MSALYGSLAIIVKTIRALSIKNSRINLQLKQEACNKDVLRKFLFFSFLKEGATINARQSRTGLDKSPPKNIDKLVIWY